MSDQEIYKIFGERLRKIRQQKQLTQTEVANALNVSQTAMNQYEKGNRKIPLSMLKKFAEYFGMSVDELVDTERSIEDSREERLIMNQCGNQLKSIREANNLSISELANEFHITEEIYASYENGTKQIPLNILINFAKHYNVSIDKIFGLNIEKDYGAAFVTTDKTASEKYEKWHEIVGFNQFNDEEFEKLMHYAKFLIYERENKKG